MARGRSTNGSGMQPRQRKDGLWECRATVGTDPGTGKPIRKSFYGKTAAEAAEKLRAATAAVDVGLFVDPSRMRLSEWLIVWLEEYNVSAKPNTRALYRSMAKNHIIPLLGSVRINEVTEAGYQRFINQLSTCDKPLAPASVKVIHAVMRSAMEAAKNNKAIRFNPCEHAKLPKIVREDISFFEEEEIPLFFEAAKGDPYRELFEFALNTGCRISEIIGLRWNRINFKTGEITIDSQYLCVRERDGNSYQFVPPKNGETRSFIAAPSVIKLLKSIQRKQKEKRLAAGPAWANDDGMVFVNEIGRPFLHSTLCNHFRAIMDKAGLKGRAIHSFRHSHAIELLRAGVDPKTVSKNLGHASVEFTMDCYVSVTSAMKNDAALRLEERIKMRGYTPK